MFRRHVMKPEGKARKAKYWKWGPMNLSFGNEPISIFLAKGCWWNYHYKNLCQILGSEWKSPENFCCTKPLIETLWTCIRSMGKKTVCWEGSIWWADAIGGCGSTIRPPHTLRVPSLATDLGKEKGFSSQNKYCPRSGKATYLIFILSHSRFLNCNRLITIKNQVK